MKIEIKHRWRAKILFQCDADSLKIGLEIAVKNKVNLEGAYLEGAYLEGAYLEGAYLKDAYLEGAYLEGAYLKDAYLKGAYLEGAYLKDAYLEGAYLKDAYLKGAYLEGADLEGADLEGADLEGADLEGIKKDYFSRLTIAKNEVAELYKSIRSGKINGTAYVGECSCFVGTIANIRKESHDSLGINLRPESSSPTERWFLGIRTGDTPENNSISQITAKWTEEFMRENEIKIPQMKVSWE